MILRYQCGTVEVALIDYIGADERPETRLGFVRNLASVAAWLDCVSVEYADGERERYTFRRADGSSLSVQANYDATPASTYLSWKLHTAAKPVKPAKPEPPQPGPARQNADKPAAKEVPEDDAQGTRRNPRGKPAADTPGPT